MEFLIVWQDFKKDFRWNLLAVVPSSILGIIDNLCTIITLGYWIPCMSLKWYTKVIDKSKLYKSGWFDK